MNNSYLTPGEVGLLHAEHEKNMSLIHLNAQSARNKQEQIFALIAALGFEPDVFLMTETWYRNDSDVLRPPGYITYFINRL